MNEKELEKIINQVSKEEIEVPESTYKTVNDRLNNLNKKEKRGFFKTLGAGIAATVLLSGISLATYTIAGGEINGKPVIEWLGIGFSDKYEEYVVPVEGEFVEAEGAKLTLTGKLCNEEVVVLEFNLDLNEEAQKKIGKLDITNGNYIPADEEECGLGVGFNNLRGYRVNNSLILDGKEYDLKSVQCPQKVAKLSDSQYKITQMFFLTEEILDGKEEFTIKLGDILVENYTAGTEDEFPGYIEIGGEFNVKLSKENVGKDTKVVEQEKQQVIYNNMTVNLDKVTVTPIQTIIKLTSETTNVSDESFVDDEHENYIGWKEYELYDKNKEKVSFLHYQKITVILEDGTVLTEASGDLRAKDETGDMYNYDKDFKNAKMIHQEYIVIETKEGQTEIDILPYLNYDKYIVELDNGFTVKL